MEQRYDHRIFAAPFYPIEVAQDVEIIAENGPPYLSRCRLEFLPDFFRTGPCIQVGTRYIFPTRSSHPSEIKGRGHAQKTLPTIHRPLSSSTITIIHYHHQQPSTLNNSLFKIKVLCPDDTIHCNICYQHCHLYHSPPHHHPHQRKRSSSHRPRPSHHRHRYRKPIIIIVIATQSSTLSYSSRNTRPIH